MCPIPPPLNTHYFLSHRFLPLTRTHLRSRPLPLPFHIFFYSLRFHCSFYLFSLFFLADTFPSISDTDAIRATSYLLLLEFVGKLQTQTYLTSQCHQTEQVVPLAQRVL